MNVVRIFTLSIMSLISIQTFAQGKVADLKNPTIKEFLTSLDGTEATAEKTVKKYCTQEVIDNAMIPMGMDVLILGEDGNCVTFRTTWVIDEDDKEEGTTIMYYDICEEGGKITAFELNFDY